ncbi:MAG: zinc-ribbon domain-containing protein [Clostridia bacterium]|nr:zinc-ribbon domain-containing protein [Clostridia bacterium]
MYCKNCGKQIDDKAVICPACGVPTDNFPSTKKEKKNSNSLAIVGFVLAFIIPLAGLICSVIAYRQSPENEAGGRAFSYAGMAVSIALLCANLITLAIEIAALINIGPSALI